jgi:hypothetical protein
MEYRCTSLSTPGETDVKDLDSGGKIWLSSVCVFVRTGIVIRWTWSSVTWTPPLIKRQLEGEDGQSMCSVRKHSTWTTSNALDVSLGRNR